MNEFLYMKLLKANIGLELVNGFNDLQQYYDQVLTERTMSEFTRLAGILGKTVQNNAERLIRTELAGVQTEAQKHFFIANRFEEYHVDTLGTACRS
ncbi:MAG: hypothetical protein LUF78_09325 [Clostridiales bacterium]|nr:hypothetical protein [Clostridiales bacterium]